MKIVEDFSCNQIALRYAGYMSNTNTTSKLASGTQEIADALEAQGIECSIEHQLATVHFSYHDGRYVVIGSANGVIGADIYNSEQAFTEGHSPVGDWEIGENGDESMIVTELLAALAE